MGVGVGRKGASEGDEHLLTAPTDSLIPTNKRNNSGIPHHPVPTMSSEDGGHWFGKSLKQRCARGTGNKEGGQADSRVHDC